MSSQPKNLNQEFVDDLIEKADECNVPMLICWINPGAGEYASGKLSLSQAFYGIVKLHKDSLTDLGWDWIREMGGLAEGSDEENEEYRTVYLSSLILYSISLTLSERNL